MSKYCMIIYSLIIFSIVKAQKNDDCYLSVVLKDQKGYFETSAKKDRANYISLIKLAPWVRPKVIDEIKKIAPATTICNYSQFNILEGYDLPDGYIFGLIWVDSLFFEYTNAPAVKAGSNLSVSKKTFSSLQQEERDIVSKFSIWDDSIFRSKLPRGKHVVFSPLFYLATKVSHENNTLKVRTIAFRY